MLSWIALIVSILGVLLVGVGTFYSFLDQDNENSNLWGFYLTLGGTVIFLIGWGLFGAYLFFTKQLDLTPDVARQARAFLPNPDEMRKVFAECDDKEFARKVGVSPMEVPKTTK